MFREERCEEILKILNEEGFSTVKNLSDKLHYSPATIRRDLVHMKQKGMIEKSYGGATPSDTGKFNVLPYELRKHNFTTEKKHIAEIAAGLIKENQVIFIDGSTTAACIIENLSPKSGITVVTNNLENCILLQRRGIRCYCTGGELSPAAPVFSGSLACNSLCSINTDIMFFSSKSLSTAGNISEYSETLSEPIKFAMRNSAKTVYLADSSKIGTSSMFNICNLSEINTVISEIDISGRFERVFENVEFLF